MKALVNIPDDLLQRATKLAAESGRTVAAVIEETLREGFDRQTERREEQRYELPILNLGPPLPGVDLDNSAALLDLMDDDDGPL